MMISTIPANKYCVKIFDGTHETPKPIKDGRPLVTSKNILGGKLNLIDTYNISEENYQSIQKRSAVSQWDVLFSMIGSIGEVYLEKNKQIPYAIKNVGVFSCGDEYKAKWLYYYLLSPASKVFIKNYLAGAVQKFLALGTLREYPILPFDSSKKSFVDLLSALDAKIELNNCINAELEAMAKTLYDYWFVQFDFPNENGKPYKTSGGKMAWNEELKREIPKGWEVKEMNKLLTKNTAKFNFTDDKHDIDTLDLSVMPSATMCLNEKNSSSAFGTNLFKLSRFDILFGGIRPYLLKAGFSPFEGLVTGTVHSFRVKNENEYNFAILTMTHESMFNFAVANSKGTKMPVIGADDLLTYKVAYNEEIVKNFNECIRFRDIIAHNIIENQKLAEIRDWLLPMLMNGQVKVE